MINHSINTGVKFLWEGLQDCWVTLFFLRTGEVLEIHKDDRVTVLLLLDKTLILSLNDLLLGHK